MKMKIIVLRAAGFISFLALLSMLGCERPNNAEKPASASLTAPIPTATNLEPAHTVPKPNVAKFCFEGTIWVKIGDGNSSWGSQQLDAETGKPIRCQISTFK